jgi:hypothetical protein
MANLGYFVQATAQGNGYIQSMNGDYLQSQNNDFYAIMQTDGNFCVYAGTPSNPLQTLWCSMSNQPCNCFFFAAVQSDGNFCVYTGSPGNVLGQALWCSGSGNQPTGDYFLTLENDGDLNVYQGTPSAPGDLMWGWETSPQVPTYKVAFAAYGALAGGNQNSTQANTVTAILQDQLNSSGGIVNINNTTMGGDPAPGNTKHFGAIVIVNGAEQAYACQENQTINFNGASS